MLQVSEPEPHGPEVASDLGSVAPVVPQVARFIFI